MNKKIILIILIIIIAILIPTILYGTTYPFKNVPNPMIKTKENNLKEKDYVNTYCKGVTEYTLPDKTRVDCLTEEYAIEFEWASKWAESVGQSLYYAKMTDKKPAVAIIMKSPKDERYIKRINATDKDIKVFKIKAYE